MLRELLALWRKTDRLNKALEHFLNMIDRVEEMFTQATECLFGNVKWEDAARAIYKTDTKVNKRERKVRKRLVEHLAINPRGDAPACLILMSTSKDAERAGDYCKNLLDVARMAKKSLGQSAYADELHEMRDMVSSTFALTREAFAEDDQTVAHEVIAEQQRINRGSDAMVQKVASDETLDPNEAVCLALAFRFLKRVNAHLGNIASSVVMPLHKIDYFDEKMRTEKGDVAQPENTPEAVEDTAVEADED